MAARRKNFRRHSSAPTTGQDQTPTKLETASSTMAPEPSPPVAAAAITATDRNNDERKETDHTMIHSQPLQQPATDLPSSAVTPTSNKGISVPTAPSGTPRLARLNDDVTPAGLRTYSRRKSNSNRRQSGFSVASAAAASGSPRRKQEVARRNDSLDDIDGQSGGLSQQRNLQSVFDELVHEELEHETGTDLSHAFLKSCEPAKELKRVGTRELSLDHIMDESVIIDVDVDGSSPATRVTTSPAAAVGKEQELTQNRATTFQPTRALAATTRRHSSRREADAHFPSAATQRSPAGRQRTPIAQMRQANLAKKSSSAVLLELLMGRRSEELLQVEQEVIAEQHPRPTAAGSNVNAEVVSAARVRTHVKLCKTPGVSYIAKCSEHLLRVVKTLLARGADPCFTDSDGYHSLMLSVQFQGPLAVSLVRMLIEKGADATACVDTPSERLSLLDVALQLQNAPVVALLLRHGALPAARPKTLDDSSSSHESASESSSSEDKTSSDMTLMAFAQRHGFGRECKERLSRSFWEGLRDDPVDVQSISALLSHGLPVDMCDAAQHGRTALFCFVKDTPHLARHLPVITTLLQHGASPNARDDTNTHMAEFLLQSRLPVAARVLSLLLEHGLDPYAFVDDTEQSDRVGQGAHDTTAAAAAVGDEKGQGRAGSSLDTHDRSGARRTLLDLSTDSEVLPAIQEAFHRHIHLQGSAAGHRITRSGRPSVKDGLGCEREATPPAGEGGVETEVEVEAGMVGDMDGVLAHLDLLEQTTSKSRRCSSSSSSSSRSQSKGLKKARLR